MCDRMNCSEPPTTVRAVEGQPDYKLCNACGAEYDLELKHVLDLRAIQNREERRVGTD